MRRLIQVLDPFLLILAATVALASLTPARGQAAHAGAMVSDGGIVLLFFLHGAKLSREAIGQGLRNWRVHLAVLASSFVLFPLLGLGLAQLRIVPPAAASGMLFLCLLPSTVQSSVAFTAIAGGDVAAAVCSASLSNLVGVVATPLLVSAVMHRSGALSLGSLETIALQLLAPFAAGHLLRPWLVGFLGRHKRLVGYVDRGTILIVVYNAFSASVVQGIWSRLSAGAVLAVAGLCLALLAVVLAVTWAVGRFGGFSDTEAIVVQFCGSKKSLVSGVPMAGVLFPSAELGLVILPLMIFHQLQLIACAFLARAYRRRAEARPATAGTLAPAASP